VILIDLLNFQLLASKCNQAFKWPISPMKTAKFVRHAPRTVEETLRILAEVAPKQGRILAGGQSLVPIMAFRMAQPAHLVDINNVEGLDRLLVETDQLCIGALVRHAAFHRPVVDGPLGRLMSAVAQNISHYAVRSRGTFCGSLAHADPASEWCLVAATLGATLLLKSKRGDRTVTADDFLSGIMSTSLAEDELLAEARIPLLPNSTRFGFYEFSRRAGDFAMAAALVTFQIEAGLIVAPCVGVGAAEAKSRRIPEAEAALQGQLPGIATFKLAAQAAANAIEPLEDMMTSGDYRRDLVRAVTERALHAALSNN
jgi:aerobic carbon-monoxide dehydrogenase medium subunit